MTYFGNSSRRWILTVVVFIYLIGSVQRSFLAGTFLDGGSLGHRNLINHQTNTTLRDDIRYAVSELDVHNNAASTDAKHREDVDNRVGTPRDDSPPLDTLDKITNMRISFKVGSIAKTNEECVDDVHEWDHRSRPEFPSCSQIVSRGDKFTGVSQDNHQDRGSTQSDALVLGFIGRKLHDQNDFNQKKRHG